MNMRNLFRHIFNARPWMALPLAIMALWLCACSSDPAPAPAPPLQQSRTILVYMVANNDLGRNGYERADLREMMHFAAQGGLDDKARLLVYRDTPDGMPDRLVEIMPDSTQTTLMTYDDNLCAIDSARMSRVMSDVRSIAPSESYGLIFWSHGTGWIEESTSRSSSAALRSFGLDDGKRMRITSMARVLDKYPSDWIYFDCCHMGTIEVLYELRNAARHIVSSTPELPLEGMPYHINLPLLFSSPADLSGAAASTYRYYLTDPDATTQSCGISVTDTRALSDLAAATAAIMDAAPGLPAGYTPIRYGRGSLRATIFDFRHYIMALDASDQLKQAWDRAYSKAIVYSAATPTCYGIDMSHFTGMGSHIVSSMYDVQNGYDSYAWWADVVSRNPSLTQRQITK